MADKVETIKAAVDSETGGRAWADALAKIDSLAPSEAKLLALWARAQYHDATRVRRSRLQALTRRIARAFGLPVAL